MCLAQHKVLGQVIILLPSITATVKNRPQGKMSHRNLVVVAVTGKRLVRLSNVPVQTLIPLMGVIESKTSQRGY